MGKGMLGFPNRVDDAQLSGGSWVSTLPIQNLQNSVYAVPAQTTDAKKTSTVINVDFGRDVNLRAWVMRDFNCTQWARIRVTGAASPDYSDLIHDGEWGDVWPVVYEDGVLEWEDDNWYDGKYTADELEHAIVSWEYLLPKATLARYWRIEIDDTENPAGFIQIGRLFASPVWQFETNLSYGSSLTFETDTVVKKARSGTKYFDVQPPVRVWQFSVDWMKASEAFTRAFELQRQAGVHREVFFVYDPDDKVHALRRRMLGRMRKLSPIEHPSLDVHKTAFEIEDWI